MDTLPSEAISPELVLVTPELRWRAITELCEAEAAATFAASLRVSEERPPPEDRLNQHSLPAELLLYVGWQAFTGAAFGFGAFLVFVALLLLKPFIAG